MLWRHRFRSKAGVAQDAGEEVVEVVSDTAGEHPNTFEFLGLAERLLMLPPVTDVRTNADHAFGDAVQVEKQPAPSFEPAYFAVSADNAVFDVQILPALDRMLDS